MEYSLYMVNKFVPKCVTISIEQERFLKDEKQEDFKLSKFLQDKLWDYMRERENMEDLIYG